MRLHRITQFAAALAFLVAGAWPVTGACAQAGDPVLRSGIVTFEAADFVLDKGSRPPGDSAAWQAVSLPDEWRRRMQARFREIGWYRFRIDLAQAPTRILALHIPHRRAHRLDFYVNGHLLASSSDMAARGGSRASESRIGTNSMGTPLFLNIPPSLLTAGENFIHVRMRATSVPFAMHGLSQITFGDARPVRKAHIVALEKGYEAQRTFFAMALAGGLITLFLWLARRSDRVMLWFTIALLTWALVSVPRLALRYLDLPLLNSVLTTFMNYGLVVPAVILCLRVVGLRWRWFEAALWSYLLIEVTHPLWSDGDNIFVRLGWDVLNTALLLAGVTIVLYAAKRPLRWPVMLEVAALSVMAVLMFWEVARYLGWIDMDSTVIRHYHVPVMLFAIGAAIFEGHVVAIWRMERTNADLEQRVAEKTREIEEKHAQAEDAKREQALALERQRILADMHDGVGASLIGLLRHVQSGGADRTSIEQRVQESLQEMRIAIDAMQPLEGDLAAVLGSLRYRLDDMIRATGVSLVWEVEELPVVEGLKPSTVFALQRILLEAIANALKHSGARQLRLTARAQDGSNVEIRVEDDGRGFDVSGPAAGLGLTNMRARASRIGAQLEISSRSGDGTVVRLLIPRILPGLSENAVSGKPDARALHDLVPAPGVA